MARPLRVRTTNALVGWSERIEGMDVTGIRMLVALQYTLHLTHRVRQLFHSQRRHFLVANRAEVTDCTELLSVSD